MDFPPHDHGGINTAGRSAVMPDALHQHAATRSGLTQSADENRYRLRDFHQYCVADCVEHGVCTSPQVEHSSTHGSTTCKFCDGVGSGCVQMTSEHTWRNMLFLLNANNKECTK